MHFCVQNTTHKQEIMYTNFLQEEASSQISEFMNPNELTSDELQLPEKQATQRGPQQDSPGRLFGDFSKHKLEKLLLERTASSSMPDSAKCALHIQIEVKQDAFVSSVLFLFTKSLGWRNIGTDRLSKCTFFSTG